VWVLRVATLPNEPLHWHFPLDFPRRGEARGSDAEGARLQATTARPCERVFVSWGTLNAGGEASPPHVSILHIPVRPATLDSRTNVRYHDHMDATNGLLRDRRHFSLSESSVSPFLGHALTPHSSRGRALPGSRGLPMPQAMSVLSGVASTAVCYAGLASTLVYTSQNKKSSMGTITGTGISPSACRAHYFSYRTLPPPANTPPCEAGLTKW